MVTRSPREVWLYTQQWFNRLILGGAWAVGLPLQTRQNMRWFWFDGLFAAASDNIYATYISVYILALGATRERIGLMSSLSSLTSAILLLPGALLVERLGRRKEITLVAGGGVARALLLMLAIAPLIWQSPEVIWIAIALSVGRDAIGFLSFPAWTSMTGDIVPAEGRGRYLGSRFFVMGFASIATTLAMGWIISRMTQPNGYQLAMLVAFGLGLISTFCFARLHDPHPAPPAAPVDRRNAGLSGLIRVLRSQPAFLALCLTLFVWNFSLMIAGPFFTVYQVQGLHATPAMVGLTSVAQNFTTMLAQRQWGVLTDRWGARRIQMISMLTIPLVPWLWVLASQSWHIIFVNMVAGVLWSGYNLGAFSFLLHIAPDEERARYSAIYQLIVMLGLSAGAAAGSVIIGVGGYHGVFIASSVGRFIAALMFTWLLRHHH